ncbi:HPt (histidine-containing phosphotransfer) domain-containing protein [Ferrimonas sediminum]|uniref:HPt (Histidine-containing phosphotransfer) domain-containing protein n=1 Tax=Ferrimonas sediminum TaxID=718193 RepID=A0A1G8M3G9_9GAMM|nr:Hpt domain-containing protein [Ferrimonas sediminum]SDI62488.1 HPt (histidine-containing phosphotransfer) domain-containing protein [Ferrimonas sediminum]
MTSANTASLDLQTLDAYCSAIGAATLLKSVVMFEQMAPEYLQTMAAAMQCSDKPLLCSEAHKLKGAAGSVGLKRIQMLSQQLQCGDEPQWQAEHGQWYQDIESHLEEDIASLKAYLSARA